MKITKMITIKSTAQLRAYFTLVEGSILMKGWQLLQHSNGEFFIVPPVSQYVSKRSGESKLAKVIEILDYDFEGKILLNAIREYEKICGGGEIC